MLQPAGEIIVIIVVSNSCNCRFVVLVLTCILYIHTYIFYTNNMQRSKSRRDLTDEIDFSDKMLNALSLARSNASRASSRDSFRSVQEPYWNYESGGWGTEQGRGQGL